MEKIKKENTISSSFSDHIISNTYPLISSGSSSTLDLFEGEKGSLGFMDLLGVQNFISTTPSLFDFPLHQSSSLVASNLTSTKKPTTKEALNNNNNGSNNNQPATPNTSSVSSASSEALNDDHQHETKIADQDEDIEDEGEEERQEEEDGEAHEKTKKQLKAKKTNQKRQTEPRFAFMTKSEVDHLEDGYRWRKYGQKAVKNSLFPRSYYRCTSASCNVKKRVERSFNDPSVVVTTYEGQHTHPSPLTSRQLNHCGAPLARTPAGASTFAMPYFPRTTISLAPRYQFLQHHQQQRQHFGDHALSSILPNSNNNFGCDSIPNAAFLHHEISRRFCTPTGPANLLTTDHGLLQDIVPSHMLKQKCREKEEQEQEGQYC